MISHLNSIRERKLSKTLEILTRKASDIGVTRLANITKLDYVGMPVFTAIRPKAKSLTTSQGKGWTENEAKCSALMESIEVFFAEECIPNLKMTKPSCLTEGSYVHPNDIGSSVIYRVEDRPFDWICGKTYEGERKVYLPFSEFSLDSTNSENFIYGSNSTGLAGGNTKNEALLHSALENIERCIKSKIFKVEQVPSYINEVLSPHFRYQIIYEENEYNCPVFEVHIAALNPFENQVICKGKGCHLNKDIAISRAVTEALQSRATLIAGSRDDLSESKYQSIEVEFKKINRYVKYGSIPNIQLSSIDGGIDYIIQILSERKKSLIIYEYYNDDICVLKSKIIPNEIIHAR